MRKLILVRHSLPDIQSGVPWYEWPLSEEGRRRCGPLADELAAHDPSVIYSSTERKARETAEVIAEHLSLPVKIEEGLQENDRTGLDFTSTEEFHLLIAAFFRCRDDLVIGLETANQARERFADAIERILTRSDGIPAVVSHGVVISLFASHHLDVEPFEYWQRLKLPSAILLNGITTPR